MSLLSLSLSFSLSLSAVCLQVFKCVVLLLLCVCVVVQECYCYPTHTHHVTSCLLPALRWRREATTATRPAGCGAAAARFLPGQQLSDECEATTGTIDFH